MAKDIEPQEDFTGEFTRIAQESILRAYEEKNRERIAQASFALRDAFDKQWVKVIGKSYYLPVTASPTMPFLNGQNYTENSCPKDRNYCAKVQFDSVSWQKLPRRRIGKRHVDLYNLTGKETNGDERPIYQNVSVDRLTRLLGIKSRDKIVSVKEDHGEVQGPFEIDVEGYWRVQFAPKSDQNDPADVQLMWEGQCLIIQRMQDVILPGFYIEVADNGTKDQFTQSPGEGRKKVGTIQRFPYMVKGEASRLEYLVQKERGDKIQREKLMREENL